MKDVVDDGDQVLLSEGLHEGTGCADELGGGEPVVAASKAGHRDDTGLGIQCLEIANGFDAILFGQDNVRNDEIVSVDLEACEPLFGILDDFDVVAEPGEDFAYDLPDFRIIFDHKDVRHGDPLVGGEGEGSGTPNCLRHNGLH